MDTPHVTNYRRALEEALAHLENHETAQCLSVLRNAVRKARATKHTCRHHWTETDSDLIDACDLCGEERA